MLSIDHPAQSSEQQVLGDSATRQGDAVLQLLGSFRHLEAVVVAAESLHLRLPGQPGLANRVLRHALHLPPQRTSDASASHGGIEPGKSAQTGPTRVCQQSQRISIHLRDAGRSQTIQDGQRRDSRAAADGSTSVQDQQSPAGPPHDDLGHGPQSQQQQQQQGALPSKSHDQEQDTEQKVATSSRPEGAVPDPMVQESHPQLHRPLLREHTAHPAGPAAVMAETDLAGHLESNGRRPLQFGVPVASQEERDALVAVLEGQSGVIDEGQAGEAGAGRQPAQEPLVGEAEWVVVCSEPGRGRSGLQHRFHVKASTGSMRLSQTICCTD